MDNILQAIGGISGIIAMALPVVYVGGAYFLLTLDRQRANSPSKDDTQAGIKLVLFGLMLAGVGLAAGGLQTLLHYALSGFKGGAGPIKLALPSLLVGGGVVAGLALALLPRTNNATYRQAERYALGLLGVTYGIQMITSLNSVLTNVFTSQPWAGTAGAVAAFLVGGAISIVAIMRFGSVSGWTAPARPQAPPYMQQGGQGGGGYPQQQQGYGQQQGGYPPQGGGYPPQGGGYPPQGGGYGQGGGYPGA